MPRRPVHQSSAAGFWARVGQMLKDRRTGTTLAYLVSMLPLGIGYFVVAASAVSMPCTPRLCWSHRRALRCYFAGHGRGTGRLPPRGPAQPAMSLKNY